MNTTERFSDRVDDYLKWRPGYPVEIVRALERDAGISPEKTRVCDLGAGTGIWAELFLREGYEVTGIEPNAPMREASERLLARFPRFRAVAATAEETKQRDGAFELVVAAQAFHWFDRGRARREIQRILAPGGVCALVWNARRVDTPFLRAYEDALLRFGTDYAAVRHENVEGEIPSFFGGAHEQKSFPSHQDFDLDGLLGRARSSSYVPREGPERERVERELERVFAAHQEGGLVRFSYDTKLWFGPIA